MKYVVIAWPDPRVGTGHAIGVTEGTGTSERTPGDSPGLWSRLAKTWMRREWVLRVSAHKLRGQTAVVKDMGGFRVRHRGRQCLRTLTVAVGVLIGSAAALSAMAGCSRSAAGGMHAGPAVKVGGNPVGLAVDNSAGTVYVATGSGGLELLGTVGCDATRTSGCALIRHAPAGGPVALGVAVDAPVHTLYVANGPARTVTVLNTATCDAATTRACSSPPVLIHLPGEPRSLAVNPRTHTLYADMITATSWQVAVMSTMNCDAMVRSGCGAVVATVPLDQKEYAPLVADAATDTVYAGDTSLLAIINGRKCAATSASGCPKAPLAVGAYGYITSLSAGDAGTVYAASPGTSTVSAWPVSNCRAGDTSGCAEPPKLIRAGPGPFAFAEDPTEHTLYVTNVDTNAVSMVNTAACNVSTSNSCPSSVPAFPVGSAPVAAAADLAAHTLYVANAGGGTLSVIDTATCNARTQRGCPDRPPTGTVGLRHTPYTCVPDIAAFQSGQPAAQLTRGSVRVASGTIEGRAWSVWAKKVVLYPYGIEQGGLVTDNRWYALCDHPLSPDAGPSIEVIDSPGHGTVYGFIQHSTHVNITLSAAGAPLVPPHSVLLHGMTFFIESLPKPACSYHAMTMHAQAPDWGATTQLTFGTCEPGRLVNVPDRTGFWGPTAQH
jgi:DNA-binding beta-propeller fold protein YncE